jgi:hypothetical protein
VGFLPSPDQANRFSGRLHDRHWQPREVIILWTQNVKLTSHSSLPTWT